MISTILPYLLECLLCGIAFIAFYHLVLAKEKSFAFNRLYLVTTMILSLTLPLLHVQTGAGGGGDIATVYMPEVQFGESQESTPTLAWMDILAGAYLLIMACFLVRLFVHLYHIRQDIRRGDIQEKGEYKLVHIANQTPISTFFNYIFWHEPVGMSEQEREMVLRHELAHVKQWHSLDLILVHTLSAIFWILPIWKYYRNALEETHEYLADKEVLRSADPQYYGSLIARYTLSQAGLSLTHSFANQSLKRITMIKNTLHAIKPLKMLMALPLAAVMFWTVSCEEAEIVEEDQVTDIQSVENVVIEEKVETTEEVFTIVDDKPMPAGGMEGHMNYMIENLNYPAEAKRKGVEGRVYVQFIVNEDGSISDVKTIKGIGSGCDAEAERVVREMPDWSPGKQDGQNVKVRMVIPVVYKLS